MEQVTDADGAQAQVGLHVFAAGSLQAPFDRLAELWREDNGAHEVKLTYANARDLAERIEAGERADVFASASPEHPGALHARGLLSQPQTFATNRLVIAVPMQSDARDAGVLARPGSRVVIEVEGIPLGDYTRTLLAQLDGVLGIGFTTRVMANIVSQEETVSAVLARLDAGQADAAVVYNTDVPPTSGRLRAVEAPVRVAGTYVIATVPASPQPEAGAAWLDLIRGPSGQRVLRDFGFDAARSVDLP